MPAGPRPWLIRLARTLVRVFFRSIELVGADRVPRSGPLLVVANHHNSLVDPALVLAELEERGGEAAVPLLARVLKRPVWDAVHRLASVGAVSLRVEPPDTAGSTATERVVALHGEPPTLLERDTLFKRRARRRELYEALEALGGSARSATWWSSSASARR